MSVHMHNTAQNSSDNLPSYPPDNYHHISYRVYWSEISYAEINKQTKAYYNVIQCYVNVIHSVLMSVFSVLWTILPELTAVGSTWSPCCSCIVILIS